MTKINRRAFRFFCANAGGVVGEQALGAASLARAEEFAQEAGWHADWYPDPDRDGGPRDWGWNEHDCRAWERVVHTCEFCLLRDGEDNVIASLSGIWDASADYRRVVAAELASEALSAMKGGRNGS